MYGKIQLFLFLLTFCTPGIYASVRGEPSLAVVPFGTNDIIITQQANQIKKKSEDTSIFTATEVEEFQDDNTEVYLSDEDIDLIALVTMAEAEGESEYGKRLVIDTILNRINSEFFPDTAYEVIYQPTQFSSMWNGRVNQCYVMDDICRFVKEEVQEITNCEVIFFTAGNYSRYGNPLFQEGNHYFSSYE